MRTSKVETGFSLFELLITIVIVGIIAAIALPNIISWLPEMRLKRAARDLYSTIVNTRMNAIKQNSSMAIVFDTANDRYHICDDWGADGTWIGVNDATGGGDNNIVATYCLDGTLQNDPTLNANCALRPSRITFGRGDSTIPAGGVFQPDNVTFANNLLIINSQGFGSTGYIYLQHQDATTSFAVTFWPGGVVRTYKSVKGAAGYVL